MIPKHTELRRAQKIARAIAPTFDQKLESAWDVPIPITLDKPNLEARPPLYYAIREDKQFYYCLFALYHYWDPKARHMGDFEGVMNILHKPWADRGLKKFAHNARFLKIHLWQSVLLQMSICHHRILIYEDGHWGFHVEAGGHGISKRDTEYDQTYLHLDNMDLVNMLDAAHFSFTWDELEAKWNPWVKSPRQWRDQNIEKYVRKKRPAIPDWSDNFCTTSEGWMWDRPDMWVSFLCYTNAGRRRIPKFANAYKHAGYSPLDSCKGAYKDVSPAQLRDLYYRRG